MARMTFSTRIALILLLGLAGATAPSYAAGGSYALHDAVLANNAGDVQKELANGADVNAKDQAGFTPLFYAVQKGYGDIVGFLINRNANVNATDTIGNTPLHFAAGLGNVEICKALVSAGASTSAQNLTGGTPLAIARAGGNTQIIQALGGQAGPPRSPYPNQPVYPDQPVYRGGPGVAPQQEPAEPDPIADPNVVRAAVLKFQGLQEAIDTVNKRSRLEGRYWLEEDERGRSSLAKAVHMQVRSEYAFLKDIAVKEKATKTVTALDNVLKNRSGRYLRMIKKIDEQDPGSNTGMSTSARGRSRTSGRSRTGMTGGTISRGGRSTRYGSRSSRTRGSYGTGGQVTGGSAAYSRGPVTTTSNETEDPNIFKVELKPVKGFEKESAALALKAEDAAWKWLNSGAQNVAELARIVNDQFKTELIFVRKPAVEEDAKKTVAAIDGLLLARQLRLEKLIQDMEDRVAAATANPDQADTGATSGRRRGPTGAIGGVTDGRRRY